MTMTPNYIKALLRPQAPKSTGRRVWSIDLESVWLPFFTATNAMGDTRIPHEAMGAPLRLAYETDGSVKFSKNGKPVIKVAKDIADNVRLVRENFVAGLLDYATSVKAKHEAKYLEQIKLNIEAGRPIAERDTENLEPAFAQRIEAELAEATEKGEEAAPKELRWSPKFGQVAKSGSCP